MVPHPGRAHPQGLRQRIHRERSPHGVAVARAGNTGHHHLYQLLASDQALRQLTARFPKHHARAAQLAVYVGVEHRSARQHNGRQVHRGRSHQGCGSGLVASRRKHDAIEGITGQDLNQAKVGEVTIKGGGGAAARLLKGMRGKFEGQSPSIADARLHPFGEGYVDPIARDQVAAALCDANDGPAGLQLFTGDAVVAIALQVDGGFARFYLLAKP